MPVGPRKLHSEPLSAPSWLWTSAVEHLASGFTAIGKHTLWALLRLGTRWALIPEEVRTFRTTHAGCPASPLTHTHFASEDN